MPSSEEVKDLLERCLLWYERQDECTPTSLLLLKCVQSLAAANLKQLTWTPFCIIIEMTLRYSSIRYMYSTEYYTMYVELYVYIMFQISSNFTYPAMARSRLGQISGVPLYH